MSENNTNSNAKSPQIIKDAVILFAITLVAALLLALVNEITKGPIAEAEAKAKAEAYNAVFTEAASIDLDNEAVNKALEEFDPSAEPELNGATVNEAGVAMDESGNIIGYVMTVTSPNGYGGDITLAIGITTEGKITSLSFVTLNETASLGMEADKPAFKGQYEGKEAVILDTVKSETPADNEISAISSATVTSVAVTEAVNAGIVFVNTKLNGGVAVE